MNIHLLIENLTNPALLFFLLGIIAVMVKSDLEIPPTSSRFISLYLLLAIGFRGGQEIAHEPFTLQITLSVILALILSTIVPVYTFFILKRKFSIHDSGAIAAAYGSVSAVTFVTASTYLESYAIQPHGYMVAIMAFMESPAIVMGLILISLYAGKQETRIRKREIFVHSITTGSVLLILGSLVIGLLASEKHAEAIKPFTNDLFRGFLAIFLLDMGISSGRNLKDLFKEGLFPLGFAIIIPLVNGSITAWISGYFITDIGDRFIFAVLAASASYIAVPAAMKIAVPKANPGLFLPMALAITFPLNITIGLPLYLEIVRLNS